jgi:hypothetical protein
MMHSRHSLEPHPIDALDAGERARVESLLAAITQPRLPSELAGQDAAVAAISARIRPRRPRRPHLTLPPLALPAIPLRGRAVCVLLATGCFLAGTTGAAIAGSLPAAVQDLAHGVLRHVGVSVPGGVRADQPRTPASGKGAIVSTVARDGSTSGHAKGAAVSTAASGGKSQAGSQHGTGKSQAGSQHGTGKGTGAGPGTSGGFPDGQGRSDSHPHPQHRAGGQASTHAHAGGGQAARGRQGGG